MRPRANIVNVPRLRNTRRAAAAIALSLVFAGCWGDDEPSLGQRETAQAWVDALNAGNYQRACELSVVKSVAECVELYREKPFGENLEVGGFDQPEDGPDEARFALSSKELRRPRGTGWTAYAPMEGFSIEREGDEYRVHVEVSIIK